MNNRENLLLGLAAAVGGAFLSVIGPDLLRLFWPPAVFDERTLLSPKLIYIIFLGSLLLLIVGLGLFNSLHHGLVLLSRYIYAQIGWYRIGILYDERVGRCCTEITPDEWAGLLQAVATNYGKKVSISLLNPAKKYTGYHVIINPYGSNYPETDSATYPVYNNILEYMREGGSFVNVADIPMYYAYNADRNQTIDRIPPTYVSQGNNITYIRPFQEAPLMRELSLRVEPAPNSQIPFTIKKQYERCAVVNVNTYSPDRVAQIERHNVDTIIDPICPAPQDYRTPLFLCRYGKGQCLISLIWLDRVANRPIASVIANLVVDQLLR